LASETSDVIIISASGFSLQVSEMNFFMSEKADFTAADVKGYETRTRR